ncbi:MAG: hypothetical protein ACE5D7_04720 [Fidelibacterota bacterium]
MSETLGWDQIDIQEEITEEEQKASDNISSTTPVGVFIITVVSSTPEEKTFNAYSCYAAKLKMRIEEVLKIEQPLLDGNGKKIMHEGKVVNRVQVVKPENAEKIKTLFAGQFIIDDINLFNPKEKEAMKKRRLFVAKKLGLINNMSRDMSSSVWANVAGSRAIVTTEWNHWKDKMTGQPKKNVKVAWDGYEYAPRETGMEDKDLDASFDIEAMDNQEKDEEFDI